MPFALYTLPKFLPPRHLVGNTGVYSLFRVQLLVERDFLSNTIRQVTMVQRTRLGRVHTCNGTQM
jgi:hypothetical protein